MADALAWAPDRRFDAVLVDAPCSASGTIRRHPDVAFLPRDLAALVALQDALLARAWDWLAPGGRLVFCTCSLLPAEGEDRVARFLAARRTRGRSRPTPRRSGSSPPGSTPAGACGCARTTGPTAAAWTASMPPA